MDRINVVESDVIDLIRDEILESGCFELEGGSGEDERTIAIEVKSASFQEMRMVREVIQVPSKAKKVGDEDEQGS